MMPTSTATNSFKDTLSNLMTAYWDLTKPGVTIMVLISMVIGYFMGSTYSVIGFDFITFMHATVGTWLIASGTAAYNQYIERDLDKLMIRTQKRPLPIKRISKNHALIFSSILMAAGLLYLLIQVNLVAGFVSALTSILYLGIYTPLKRISAFNVAVGSIPGALPPVGGWAAATGSIDHPAAWILFAIVFFWQIPHVLSIAWLAKDDYEKAGFVMLPKDKLNGIIGIGSLVTCMVLLLPMGYLMQLTGASGWLFTIVATLSAIYFFYKSILFLQDKNKHTARQLLFASLLYLPVVWLFLFIDHVF